MPSDTPRLKAGACSYGGIETQNTHRVWRNDRRPASDVDRRVRRLLR